MALAIRKNNNTRSVDELFTVNNGVLHAVSELYIMTAGGLRLIWQAIGEMWRHDDVWRDNDIW